MGKRLVCKVADVPENGLKECEAEGGLKLVVANAGGEFYGFQAVCPHQDVPLCEGLFDGSTLTCHMHLWQWDIRTGEPRGIAEAPLQRSSMASLPPYWKSWRGLRAARHTKRARCSTARAIRPRISSCSIPGASSSLLAAATARRRAASC